MGTLAAILATLASAAISYGVNRWSQKENRQYNEQQQQKAYNLSTPSNQVDELKKAGLNPNLVYGSIQPASYTANSSEPIKTELDFLKPMIAGWNREQQKMDMQFKEQQLKRMKLENTVLALTAASRIQNQDLRNSSLSAGIAQKEAQTALLQVKKQVSEKQYEQIVKAIELASSQILINQKRGVLLDVDAQAKQLEYETNKQLREYGLSLNDNYLFRILAMYIFPWLSEKKDVIYDVMTLPNQSSLPLPTP